MEVFIALIAVISALIFMFKYYVTEKKLVKISEEKSNLEVINSELELTAQKIRESMEEEIKNAKVEAKEIINIAKDKAETSLNEAFSHADEIKENARVEAEKIAGKAIETREKAELYEKTVKAMKNQIDGYGDDYLIPAQTLLDDLADEYDHEKAGQDLKEVKNKIKAMIKAQKAAECDYVENNRKKTAIDFSLDAFNGKVDTIMSKVKHDNYGKLKAMLEDALSLVNFNGSAFRNARITKEYFNLMVDQLDLAVKVQELKRKDQEEQRMIREQIREEEKARREYEKALKEAAKEEKLAQKALAEAEAKFKEASDEEKLILKKQLEELREKLKEVEAKEERAMSMAQQTKRGHVYIISNIGSFGENVYKIGLTRRLEPLDRVKELGDASVPFSFDVHAMIFSEDAPALETELHNVFRDFEMNRVNHRKEFFKVSLSSIKEKIVEKGINCHWTMKADASEYRESLKIEKDQQSLEVA